MRFISTLAFLAVGLAVLAYAFCKQRGEKTVIAIALAGYLVLMVLGIAFYDTLVPETIKLSSSGMEIGLKQLHAAATDGVEQIKKEATAQKATIDTMQGEVAQHERELQSFISDAKQLEARLQPRTLSEDQARQLTAGLTSDPRGEWTIRAGALGEQEYYASELAAAIRRAPTWKEHVHHAAPGSWVGMKDAGRRDVTVLE